MTSYGSARVPAGVVSGVSALETAVCCPTRSPFREPLTTSPNEDFQTVSIALIAGAAWGGWSLGSVALGKPT